MKFFKYFGWKPECPEENHPEVLAKDFGLLLDWPELHPCVQYHKQQGHWKSSSKKTRNWTCVEIVVYQSSMRSSWWRNFRIPYRLGMLPHQKIKSRALYRSSPTLSRSSFFCNQVFFGYNPSSSTSLLSSVGITTKDTRKVTAGADGNTRVPSITSPCPSQCQTGEGGP